MTTDIKGLNTVIKNLNNEISKIKEATLRGLIRGGLTVLRDVEITSPLTPLDLGNLRASRFLVTSNGGVSMGRSPMFVGKKGKKSNVSKLSQYHGNTISDAKSIAMSMNRPTVVLGFSAYYAAPVHEMSGTVNWSRKGSGGKWFEKAMDRNKNEILKIIQKEARVK